MKNGYFQIVTSPGGYGIKIIPPKNGGEAVRPQELITYLDTQKIPYNIDVIKTLTNVQEEKFTLLRYEDCPVCNESYHLQIDEDAMRAVARFYPPSETGTRMTFDEFFKDLRYKNIVFGVQMQEIQKHFQSEGIYCTDIVVALGKPPRHGTDAQIEYFFNTNVHAKPTLKEDGRVDYFNLNVINHCQAGEMLARIIPADPGENGVDIKGARLKPRDVKKLSLKYGHNIELSEDKMSITSKVNGHVALVEDKVFVSDVYEVENVDISTGNIEFEGSVQINGNVASNLSVVAKGNVIVNGVVEGAYIEAGGNIIIARGMNGMSKGKLKAKGNIIAKFLENTTVEADGYVNTGSMLYCHVTAGTEIIVDGKRGFITGGHVQAANLIDVKTLGATLGGNTLVEVGVNPKIKAEYTKVQKEIMGIVRTIKNIQPIVANFAEKRAKGVRFSEEQIKYVKNAIQTLNVQKRDLEEKNAVMAELQKSFDPLKKAEVIVRDVVYPGTIITINDVSMTVQSNYKYCRFIKKDGDVKMAPM